MKTCIRCGLEKPLSEFYAHTKARDRLQPRCKTCERARMRQAMRERRGSKKRMTLQELLEFIGKPNLKL
jgi:hypothetical protein